MYLVWLAKFECLEGPKCCLVSRIQATYEMQELCRGVFSGWHVTVVARLPALLHEVG